MPVKRNAYFITHPNVVISADVPVAQWPLSETGVRRMRKGLTQPWIKDVTAVYCSIEQKAIDGARILAVHLAVPFTSIKALGENDRSSTGYLPSAEFELVADEFFAHADISVRGWERAIDAQHRIRTAVDELIASDASSGHIAIVSHGAVGTLLYCSLSRLPIDRQWDQPPNGGGNYFPFSLVPREIHSWWKPFDGDQ
jgi:broad specificity phosphatase PhoE